MMAKQIGFGVELEGHREIMRKLARLSSVTQRKIVRPAVSVALTPIKKAATRKCPVYVQIPGQKFLIPGLLKKATAKGKKVKTYRRSGTVWGAVGTAKGFKRMLPDGTFQNPSNYDHLVELGTRRSAAKPYLYPALRHEKPKALAILGKKIHMGIEREARR